jgi:tetratricopeptide (TPR) repeat protein
VKIKKEHNSIFSQPLSCLLFFYFFLFYFSSVAQRSKVDSLKSLLSKELQDTSRYRALMELGRTYRDISFDSAYYFHESGLKLAEKLKDRLMQGNALNELGSDCKSDHKHAYDCYFKAMGILEDVITSSQSHSKEEMRVYAALLGNLGTESLDIGKDERALVLLERALVINKNFKFKNYEAANLGNISRFYMRLGNYTKALDYNFAALKINDELQNQRLCASCCNRIAICYSELGNREVALEYLIRALKYSKEAGDKKNYASALNNIANIYESQGKTDTALSCMRLALDMNVKMKNFQFAIVNLKVMADCYIKMGDGTANPILKKEYYQKALERLNEATKFFNEKTHGSDVLRLYVSYSTICLKTGQKAKAREYLEKAESITKGDPSYSELFSYHNAAYNYHLASKNFKEALFHREKYIQLRDSIYNEQNRKAATRSELKYEYEKKAAADSVANSKESEIKNVELKRQSAEIKARKNQQYALFGGLFLVILFSIFMFNRFKVTQKQKVLIELQKEIVEEQKLMVEEKQREVLESIRYARRIQLAQIPSEKRILSMINKIRKD